MTDTKELAQQLADHIVKESEEHWPGAILLSVIDGSGQVTDGYVWCNLAGTTVRCIVPSAIDLTGTSHVIYAVPLGGGSKDFICIGLAWNGLDNSRLPRQRVAAITDIGGNSIAGAVASVALTAGPAGVFDVSGSPVTGSGTLALSMDNQSANTVLAGPTSGGAAEPAFRALATTDIPAIDHGAGLVGASLLDDDHTQYLLRQPAADWVINDSGGNFDGRIEGDTDANLLVLDAGLDTLAIGGVAIASKKLAIYTGSDTNTGLIITRNSATQSANLLEFKSSTGTLLAYVTSDGSLDVRQLAVGNAAGINASYGLNLSHLFSDPAGGVFGGSLTCGVSLTAHNDKVLIGFKGVAANGTTYNLTSAALALRGVEADFNNQSSGVVSSGAGLVCQVQQTGSGTITSGEAIRVQAPVNSGGGSITTLYGINIKDQTLGGTNYAIVTNAGNIVFNEGGDASTDFRAEGDTDANLLFVDASSDMVGIGTSTPATTLEIERTLTIVGAVTDGYAGAITLDPGYTAATAQTVTRHNYLDIQNPSLAGAGPAALTDACVMRFDANAGTHKAVDGATTKTTPGAVDAWVKINVNGTIMYIPAYLSKTA